MQCNRATGPGHRGAEERGNRETYRGSKENQKWSQEWEKEACTWKVRNHLRPGTGHHEASNGSCEGEACLQLAKCFANIWVWFLPAQGSLPGCCCSAVWVASGQYAKSMCAWKESHSGACLHLPPTLRHNNLRDLTADLVSEVCPNVCTEPELQPLSGEVLHRRSANCQDGARVDIRGGALGEIPGCIFDMRVFTHLHPQTVPWASPPRTNATRKRRGEPMSNASVVRSPPRFCSNRRNGEGSPCYVPKIGVNAGGKTRSAIQPADEHNLMSDQLPSVEIAYQMYPGLQINSWPCHQSMWSPVRGVSPPTLQWLPITFRWLNLI